MLSENIIPEKVFSDRVRALTNVLFFLDLGIFPRSRKLIS